MLVTAELVLCALAPLASRRTHPPLLTAAAQTGVKQFDGAASAVFNNLRTPAALVAGAAFGGAFGLQLNSADAFALALAKRAYVVIAVMALASELLVVVTATCALDAMNRADSLVPAETLSCWFERNGLELENLVCTVHFFFGVLGLTAMVGLRGTPRHSPATSRRPARPRLSACNWRGSATRSPTSCSSSSARRGSRGTARRTRRARCSRCRSPRSWAAT